MTALLSRRLRAAALLAASLATAPAHAGPDYSPSRKATYPSPNMLAPDVDRLTIHGKGTTGDVSETEVKPDGAEIAQPLRSLLSSAVEVVGGVVRLKSGQVLGRWDGTKFTAAADGAAFGPTSVLGATGSPALTTSTAKDCKADVGYFPAFIDFWVPNCSGVFAGEELRSALTRGTGRKPGSNPPVPGDDQYVYTNLLVNKVFDKRYSASAMLINTDVSTGGNSGSDTDQYSVDFQISSTVRPGDGTQPGKHWMVNWDGWVAPGSGQHFWTVLEVDPNYHNPDCGPDATPIPGKSCFNPVFWFNFNNAVTQLAWLYATNNGHSSYWGRATLTNGQLTAIDWEQDLTYVDGAFSKMTRDIYLYAPGSYDPKQKPSPNPHPLAGQQGTYYKVNNYIDGRNITLQNAPANGTYAFQWVPAQVQYGITMASRDNVFGDGRILHASMVDKADLDLGTNSERVAYITGKHVVGWDSTDATMPIAAAYGQGQAVCFDKLCNRKITGDTSNNLAISGLLSVNNGMSLPFNQIENISGGAFVCVKAGNVVYLKSTPCNQ